MHHLSYKIILKNELNQPNKIKNIDERTVPQKEFR